MRYAFPAFVSLLFVWPYLVNAEEPRELPMAPPHSSGGRAGWDYVWAEDDNALSKRGKDGWEVVWVAGAPKGSRYLLKRSAMPNSPAANIGREENGGLDSQAKNVATARVLLALQFQQTKEGITATPRFVVTPETISFLQGLIADKGSIQVQQDGEIIVEAAK